MVPTETIGASEERSVSDWMSRIGLTSVRDELVEP